MAMEITNNYNNVYESTYGTQKQQTAKKEETKETAAAKKSSHTETSNNDYFSMLKKLAPSVEVRIGNTYATGRNGKTLTIDPRVLEKMQKDPKFEKEMKELIKGVEKMTKISEGLNKATGWRTVYRHSYIDANGKYTAIAQTRNEAGYKMSDKLREERKKNSEKFIKKAKEKAAKRKKELQEALEEKIAEKKEKKTEEEKTSKAEKIIKEKIAASKDGRIYMEDAEFREIVEAIKEDNADTAQTDKEKPPAVGRNLDLQV